MATIGFISKEASEPHFLTGDEYWHDLIDSLHTVQIFYAPNIDGATDWTGIDVVVDRNSGDEYNFAHLPSGVPTLFGNPGLLSHYGFGAVRGSSYQAYSWVPLNDPWDTEVPTTQSNLISGNGSLRYIKSNTFSAGTYAGGHTSPAGDNRAPIAWRFTSGHARVFHGYTISTGATAAYDDLLLASLDYAIDDIDPNSGGEASTPPPPPDPWVADYGVDLDFRPNYAPAYPVALQPYTPFRRGPKAAPGAKVSFQVEKAHPRVWQVPYPEGYPTPGEEYKNNSGESGQPL